MMNMMKAQWKIIITGVVGALIGCLTALGVLDHSEGQGTAICVEAALQDEPHPWDTEECQGIALRLMESIRDDLGMVWLEAFVTASLDTEEDAEDVLAEEPATEGGEE